MEEEPASKSDEVVGCLVLLAVAGGILWVLWGAAFDCFLADNYDYVTKRCALTHLQKAACNNERDILDVDEVTESDYTDGAGKKWQSRAVIYRFRKRPTAGPVSDDVLRDTEYLFKNDQKKWQATCELPTSK